MSKGNKTPAKSNKLKLAQSIKEKRALEDTEENVKNRGYKGHVL